MTFDNSEYNSLRTELLHHDRSCLTILQFLLAASTAIYGLVSTTQVDSSLLILLSIIWFIGFLYIVEKRSTIKRISLYIRKEIESSENPPGFGWEEWSHNNRNKNPETSTPETSTPETSTPETSTPETPTSKFFLPKISPLIIELSLLTIADTANFIWWCLDNDIKVVKVFYSLIVQLGINNNNIVFTLLLLIFIIPTLYSLYIVNQYYKYKESNQEN